jgi:hypothetical protein
LDGAMDSSQADGSTIDDERDLRAEVRERTRRQLLAVAVSAAVLVLAGVVTLVVLGGSDEDATDPDGPDPTATVPPGTAPDDTASDDTAPDNTAPGAHPSGLDPEHPLVGRPSSEAREVYPVVRVEWIDGEAMMLTMDLVTGRVGLAVEDGAIVAAGAEGCEELPGDAAVWQQQACDPSPDDGATVWGRLVQQGSGLALEPGAGADRYYELMQVVPISARPNGTAPDAQPLILDLGGGAVDESDLVAGQSVWLWITGACEERSPVSCPVDALVVER